MNLFFLWATWYEVRLKEFKHGQARHWGFTLTNVISHLFQDRLVTVWKPHKIVSAITEIHFSTIFHLLYRHLKLHNLNSCVHIYGHHQLEANNVWKHTRVKRFIHPWIVFTVSWHLSSPNKQTTSTTSLYILMFGCCMNTYNILDNTNRVITPQMLNNQQHTGCRIKPLYSTGTVVWQDMTSMA